MSYVAEWFSSFEHALLTSSRTPKIEQSFEYLKKGKFESYTDIRDNFWFAFQTCTAEELRVVRGALDKTNEPLGMVMFDHRHLDSVMHQIGKVCSLDKLRAVLPELTAETFIQAGGLHLAGREPEKYFNDMFGWTDLVLTLNDEDLSVWKRSIEQASLPLTDIIMFLKKVPNQVWTPAFINEAYENSLSCFLSAPTTFKTSCILLHEGYGFKYPGLGFRTVMLSQNIEMGKLESILPDDVGYSTVFDDRLLLSSGRIKPLNENQQQLLKYFQVIESLDSPELLFDFCVRGAIDNIKMDVYPTDTLQVSN